MRLYRGEEKEKNIMSKYTETKYSCDKCGKRVNSQSSLDIMTSLSEDDLWSRLHVRIVRIWGMHNNANYERAMLCKNCTIVMLEDALARAKNGERATEGTESSHEKGWDT
jgi:hypothetical protein